MKRANALWRVWSFIDCEYYVYPSLVVSRIEGTELIQAIRYNTQQNAWHCAVSVCPGTRSDTYLTHPPVLGGQPSSVFCSASFSKAVLVRARVLLRPVDNTPRRWAATAWPVSRVSLGWAWEEYWLYLCVCVESRTGRVGTLEHLLHSHGVQVPTRAQTRSRVSRQVSSHASLPRPKGETLHPMTGTREPVRAWYWTRIRLAWNGMELMCACRDSSSCSSWSC
ncbi:hypothetical protein CI102_7900 [Trichoderma harzianum]|nr:hypothetical protein CI102_7900 [Trichoderma harzianum]